MADPVHREATAALFKGDLGTAFDSSIWAPVRIGPLWQRCLSCNRMIAAEETRTCQCGAALPEVEPHW
jgi:hypothetical protein